MTDWWKAIEAELDARSHEAPDPWADFGTDTVALTTEQEEFLVSFTDQPSHPRLNDELDAAAPADDEHARDDGVDDDDGGDAADQPGATPGQ